MALSTGDRVSEIVDADDAIAIFDRITITMKVRSEGLGLRATGRILGVGQMLIIYVWLQ